MTIDPVSVPLLAAPSASLEQAMAYARARGPRRIDQVEAFAAELWRLATSCGYDPAVVFAQFCDETGVGTSAAWTTRLNPGGIGITDGADDGISFNSGAEAARAMLVHLSAYVRGYDHGLWRHLRLDPRYLLVLEAGYGQSVQTLADLGNGRWATNPAYATQIAVHLERIRTTTPTLAAASSHASLPASVRWVGTPNFHPRPAGVVPEAIVYHITNDRTFANVASWFRNPASRASSHFVVDRDGTIHQFVSLRDAAWTNGDIASPRSDLPWLTAAIAKIRREGGNLNDRTVTIETVGVPSEPITSSQHEALVALTEFLLAAFPTILPRRGRMLRHADINGRDRSYCPGPLFPLAEIIRAVGGDPMDMS